MPIPSLLKKLEGITDPLVKKRYLKYFQLPQDLRQLIFSTETADKIRDVAEEKNNLKKDQLWWTSHTVGMILLGETNIVDFVKTLKAKCHLTDESARKLARDINQVIFLPVKESLKKIHKVPEWPRESEAPGREKSPAPQEAPKKSISSVQSTPSTRPTLPVKPTVPETTEPRLEGNIVDLKGE